MYDPILFFSVIWRVPYALMCASVMPFWYHIDTRKSTSGREEK
jgi:hypothetical protein